MKIQNINFTSNDKRKPVPIVKTAGFVSIAGMGMCMWSGMTKNKSLKKHHKIFAWITAIGAVLHLGVLASSHGQHKRLK